MVDVRSAKKNGTENQGTISPAIGNTSFTTPEENKEPYRTPEEDFGGDVVIKEYMTFLEKKDVTKKEILSLLEAILTSGAAEWGATILDKIELRFRMRPTWVEDLISERIDIQNNEDKSISIVRYSNLVRIYNLAGSLVKYGDKEFSMVDEEDFKKSLEFVRSIPYPLLTKACDQLAIFDRAVAVATSDWALKTFTKAPKENS